MERSIDERGNTGNNGSWPQNRVRKVQTGSYCISSADSLMLDWEKVMQTFEWPGYQGLKGKIGRVRVAARQLRLYTLGIGEVGKKVRIGETGLEDRI